MFAHTIYGEVQQSANLSMDRTLILFWKCLGFALLTRQIEHCYGVTFSSGKSWQHFSLFSQYLDLYFSCLFHRFSLMTFKVQSVLVMAYFYTVIVVLTDFCHCCPEHQCSVLTVSSSGQQTPPTEASPGFLHSNVSLYHPAGIPDIW